MPSGKSKSKENTWTERDLTDAIQGERPRRSKDERKQREDRPEKRHSKDRGEEDREKDRRRKKSERHQEGEDGEGSGSRRSKDDRDRKHRDRDKERMKDDDNESGSRSKEKSRKHREDEMESSRDRRDRNERKRNKERNHGEEDNGDGQRRHRDKDERSKEKSRRHNEDEVGSSHHRRERDERTRDKERNHGEEENGNDKRRHRQKEERNKEKSRRQREVEMESSRDRRDRDERRRDKERRRDNDEDHETGRQRRKDERKRERDAENRDKDRRRDKETDERYKDGKRGEDEHHNERRRDKSLDENMRNERKKDRRKHDENDEEERERRRKKQERKEAKENNDGDSDGKDRRRKDKKRPEENFEDKQRRREDKEGRKKKGSSQDEDDYDRERNDSVEKKESARKLESNGRSASISNDAEVVEEMQDGDDYGDYEDDFEDYEDDFEDEDDVAEDENEQDKGKLLEIFEAISAENEDVRSSPFQQNIKESSRKENEKPAPKSVKSELHGRINFFAAKQKHVTEVVASKTRRRAQELQNLIELDVASYDIFDLPPLNEYELYIKSYGQSDSKQAYVQCHDDIVEKEMQTEVIDTCTKWTQYPPDDFKGCGEGDESQERNDLQENMFAPHSVDSVRLTNFLQQAGQVCLILLEEKVSARKDLMFKERNDIDISDGFIQLSNKLPFLAGRRVLDMKFNAVQTHLLLTAYDCDNNESNVDKNICLYGRGVVCYWNVNEPSQPQKILYCESSPRSCCFSPAKSSLVFAGLEDGSVVIWDIRESSSLHSTIQNKDNQWVVRRPTYSTAGVLFNENHLCPIQSILPIALPIDSAQALSRSTVLQDEPGGVAFQLASLDQSGLVNIWVVIELDKPDEAGSESDLGLSPGGRVKLIRSTSIQIESPQREVFVGSTIQASVIQFSTLDANHFYVGTDRGWVIHSTRYGEKTSPNVYRPDTESFVTISAMDVSPWNIPVLLVGCKDGTLRLHDLRKEYAVRSWPETTNGSAIVQVMWSKSRPSLFFVLDANSNLYIWDLLKKDEHPITYESFKRGKLLNFSLSNDYESLGIGLPGRKSEMLLNFEGGMIELHRLKDNLLSVQADELDRFASLVDSIF